MLGEDIGMEVRGLLGGDGLIDYLPWSTEPAQAESRSNDL